jgi:hypothetical protein
MRVFDLVPLVSSEIDGLVKPQVQAERTSRAQGMEVEGPRQAFGANRTLGETQRAMGEAEEWFRTEVAVEAIDSLNLRIHKFEKNEQRLKRQLREEKDRVKNSKAAEEGTLNLLVLAEERVCEVDAMMAVLRQDADRYRAWWLTEYYSLKALLVMLPHDRLDDVHHIAESAHARFATFCKHC